MMVPVIPGNRGFSGGQSAAVRAAVYARQFAYHPAYLNQARRWVPPPQIGGLVDQLDDNVQSSLVDVGKELAVAVEDVEAADERLRLIDEIWQDRFQALVEPLVKEMREAATNIEASVEGLATSDAIGALKDAVDSLSEQLDASEARRTMAAAVLSLAFVLGGPVFGVELVGHRYADAVGLLVALIVGLAAWLAS